MVFRGFHGSRLDFMVPCCFFMVPGRFSWFQVGFHGSRSVFMVFHSSRLVFHGSWSVFMVFHSSMSVFMVFHGSRSVFMVPGWFFMFFPKMYPPKLYPCPTIQSRSAARGAAQVLVYESFSFSSFDVLPLFVDMKKTQGACCCNFHANHQG